MTDGWATNEFPLVAPDQSESESGMESRRLGKCAFSVPAHIQTEMEDLDFLNEFTEEFDEAS